jgi:hypothetical protein
MRLAVQACQLRMNSSYRPYWHTLMRIPGTHQPWGVVKAAEVLLSLLNLVCALGTVGCANGLQAIMPRSLRTWWHDRKGVDRRDLWHRWQQRDRWCGG